MTIKYVLMAAWCTLVVSAYGQATISGIVRGADEQVLAGATIQLENKQGFAVSDDFGKFRIERLAPGAYTVLVKYLGYEDYRVTVEAPATLEVQLTEATTMTEAVVVESTRATAETPTTYTDVDRQAIEKQNFGQDLPYLLNWTPSLVTTSDAGAGVGYTGVRIRGNDATRVNVTINGIPYNDGESLGTYWVDIPDIASSSQSIQIQRGVGTSTNGGGAFGGTVNVQTNTMHEKAYGNVVASYGSFNTQRYTFRGGTGLMNDHWAFDGRVSRIRSDGYLERASSDLDSYYLSGGYYGDKTMVKAIVFGGHETTYQAWYGIDPTMLAVDRRLNYAGAIYDDNWNIVDYYDNQVDDYKQDHAQLHISHAFSPQVTANVAFHYTYGRGYFEEYNQSMAFADVGLDNITVGDSTLTYSDLITRKWLDNHFWGATYSLHYTPNKFDFTLGGGYHRYTPAKHYGEIIWGQYMVQAPIRYRYYQGDADKSDFNIYAKLNYPFTDRLNGYIDLQYRRVGYETSGTDEYLTAYDIDKTFNFFNPKAGLVYALASQSQLYLSYALAHREPIRSDYLDGDVMPKAERLDNLEFGWRKKTAHYQVELNYYYMNYKDQLVLTGALNSVGNPIRGNVGKSYRTGIEASGVWQVAVPVTWRMNVTWSRNENINYAWVTQDDDLVQRNTTIILSPSWIAGSELTWTPFANARASLLTKYVGAQYLDNTESESLKLDDYFINDLRLSYDFFPRGMQRMGLSLLVNNLFDVDYASNGYSYDGVPYVYPQAGTNFMAMLSLTF